MFIDLANLQAPRSGGAQCDPVTNISLLRSDSRKQNMLGYKHVAPPEQRHVSQECDYRSRFRNGCLTNVSYLFCAGDDSYVALSQRRLLTEKKKVDAQPPTAY